ncbi:hypothetical protein ACJJH9_19320 [Microbulbifer sp. DLAB2-AF]|uniref:hypothetical protein n=1 Tax=Microbulbifer sp. DLAB2-AF TaxID=3243395 RepID=UPI004039E830
MNKDNFSINVDLAEFHGISDEDGSNPYAAPKANENSFIHKELVKFNIWSYLSTFILLLWFGFWSYIIMSSLRGYETQSLSYSLLGVTTFLFVSHLLILFKIELARKIVVFHAFLLLFGFPIGTIIGIIMLKTFKGKSFPKAINLKGTKKS